MAFIPGRGYVSASKYRAPYKAVTRTSRTYKPASRAAYKYPLTKAQTLSIAKSAGRTLATSVYKRYKRRKQMLMQRIPVGAGSTFSYSKSGRNLMPKSLYAYWRTNQKYMVSKTFSRKLTNTNYGQQTALDIPGITQTDFADDMVRLGISTQDAINTSSTMYTKVKDIMTITNVELTTTYVDIYQLSPRRDLAVGSEPSNLWFTGVNAEASTSVPSIPILPYETPFRSKLFVLTYNVDKITRIELAPGQSHKHTHTHGINRMVHGPIQNSPSAYYGRNFTNFTMIVASGTPVNDFTNKTFVSTSTLSLDIVISRQWMMGNDSRPRIRTYAENSLNSISSVRVVTDVTVIPDSEA